MCGKGAPFAGPSSRDLVGCCHLVGVAAGCSGCCWGAACAALPLFAAEDISCYKGLEDLDRVVGHEESAVFVPDEFQGKRADSMSAHGTSKAQVLEQHEQGL